MTAQESEESIISTCLAWPRESLPVAASEIRPDHFLSPLDSLFRAILGVFCAGNEVDFASVINALRDSGELDMIGGAARVSQLTVAGGVPSGIREHIRRVRDAAAKRRMVTLLSENLSALKGSNDGVGAALSGLMEGLEQIGNDRVSARAPSVKDLVMEVVAKVDKRMRGEETESGVSTGLKSLDRLTGGLRAGSQWVVAGPAKGGKSSLALSFLNSMAIHAKRRCAFFGLEMPSVENVERLMCSVGGVSSNVMLSGKLADADYTKVTAASSRVAGAPLLFRDDIFDLSELVATIRQMKSSFPDLFGVFVDYAQLIAGDQLDKNGREREVAMVSRALRKVGMQLGLCIILLSQVNDDGKLRESRSLGMDATKIVFIEFDNGPGVRKLRLVQRDGQSGVELRVAYRGEYFQFGDLAEDEQQPTKKEHPNPRKYK